MHPKLKVFLICSMVLLTSAASLGAELSMEVSLTNRDLASFSWPQFTVQELAAGEREVLVVCKSTGSGLVRRNCFIYYWADDTAQWLPVVAFHSSTSRVDAAYLEGKIVLTSYGGKRLLELDVATLEPYYDPAELKGPRLRGKADEETIGRMSKP